MIAESSVQKGVVAYLINQDVDQAKLAKALLASISRVQMEVS